MKSPISGKLLLSMLMASGMLIGVLYVNQTYITKPSVVIGGGAGGGTVQPSQPVAITCDPQVTPDIDPNAYDADNPGTALTESTNLYRKVGATAWNSWTQGTAITGLEIGATYEFLTGTSTTDFTDNAYGPYFKWTAPCREVTVADIPVQNDEVETSLTATFYNEDESAAAQTFTAGQVKTVYLKWEAGKDEVYGNPFIAQASGKRVLPSEVSQIMLGDIGSHRAQYPNLLQLSLNSTVWDKPVRVRLARATNPSDVGAEMRELPCPVIVPGIAGMVSYCYEAPVITDIETRFAVTLDADDTNAPSVDTDGNALLYAGQMFLNSDTALVQWGNENEDGAAVGADAADTLALNLA